MHTYHFTPDFEIIKETTPTFSIRDFEKEQGVYSATPSFVRSHCGDIAKSLLDLVPDTYYTEADKLKLYPNCDIRIHRLYPNDIPAYPGWHCDGEFRETYFSQPDLNRIPVSHHLTAHVSSHPNGVSCTQFLNEGFSCPLIPPGQEITLWGQVHRLVQVKPDRKVVNIKDGQMVKFSSWSLHRAMPATIRGWRLFFRMSMWHRKNLGDGGMITKQEQVYKTVEGSGW